MGLPARAEPPADPLVELCAFRVGDEEYVLDLRRIREIVQPLPITPVPHAPAFVEGVVDLRGEVLPLVDVRRRLGLPPAAPGRGKILVLHVAARVLGLLVDAVVEVVRTPRSAIGPPPVHAGGGARLFLGVCAARERARGEGRPGRIRLLLNVKALVELDAAAAASARQDARRAGPPPPRGAGAP